MKKTYKNVKRTTTASGFNKNNRYKNNPYEKISFSHLGQQNLKNNKGRSPAQSKARDVIRKYRMQLRKLEFKRLKKLVPSMQNTSDEESNEVQILMEAVSYIDQLHHRLLHQIHSVGLPPQLIKGEDFFS
jgi:hypothetical protein